LIAVLFAAACGGNYQAPKETEAPSAEEDEYRDEDEHVADEHGPEEHMEGEDEVPEEAAEVPKPIEASEASVAEGASLYATNCAVCHGENGAGDGPTAETLDPKPAKLHEDHVQILTDGALFYIISHGRPETSMPAWENQLSEEERWHVVNLLRTFQEQNANPTIEIKT
jgi:mono/diheme cytochrome c family protein